MTRVLVFDVNETLLDLRALDPVFARLFGDPSARREWFDQLLHSAFVSTITGAYEAFGTVGMAALDILATRRMVTLNDADKDAVRDGLRTLPPHPDVRPALERLRAADFRLATLTNSAPDVADAQIANANLGDLFEQTLSADAVKRLKPAPEPYHMAAQVLGVPMSDVRLIAAHAWDVAGALRAGAAAAFVARPGQIFDPLVPQPDLVAADLDELANTILAADA